MRYENRNQNGRIKHPAVIKTLLTIALWIMAMPAAADIYFDENGECQESIPQDWSPPEDEEEGFCDIKVYMKSVKVIDGPALAPKHDLEVRGKADNQTTTWRNLFINTNKNALKTTNREFATVKVREGVTQNLKVCSRIKEFDTGLLWGGADDGGRQCEDVTISCDMAAVELTTRVDMCTGEMPPVGGPCPSSINGIIDVGYRVSNGDADFDGVPDDEDVFDDLGDECAMGTAGRGVVLYFHYGDEDFFFNLVENLPNLSKAISGYDYAVLVADESEMFSLFGTTIGGVFATANGVFPPTTEGLADAVIDVAQRGYDITFLSYAHGDYKGTAKTAEEGYTVAQIGKVTGLEGSVIEPDVKELLSGDARGHSGLLPLRAVHGVTSCFYAIWANMWRDLGAKVVGGTSGIQFFPADATKFISLWNDGTPFADAVRGAQKKYARTLTDIGLGTLYLGWSAAHAPECAWPLFSAAIRDNAHDACVQEFMDFKGYIDDVSWVDGMTGLQNMEENSAREVSGIDQPTYRYVGANDGVLPCADEGIEAQLCIDKFTPLTWH